MGKIYTDYSNMLFPNGIEIALLFQIAQSLPGKTMINEIIPSPIYNYVRVSMINDHFEDGTEIVVNLKTLIDKNGKNHASFNGITIVPPPSLNSNTSTAGTNTTAPASYTPPQTGLYTPPQTGLYTVPQTGTYTYHIRLFDTTLGKWVDIKDEPLKELTPLVSVCECGKDKHGFANHANWCGKNKS